MAAKRLFGMSRGGIIFQPILFDPGVVVLSAVVPPPGGPGSGSGGVIAPILAGFLLLLGALGFSPGAVGPSSQGSPAPAPGFLNAPAGAAPAPAPGAPVPTTAPPPVASVPPAAPQGAPAPQQQASVPPAAAAPSLPTPAVLSSVPLQRPSGPPVSGPGQPTSSHKRRPVLPFTGANLLTPMAVGLGLIILGLVLRRSGGSAQSRIS